MCGIVGILGEKQVTPLLVDGLRRLEYRGYDSAGIATLVNGHIERRRAEGKLANLEKLLGEQPLAGTVGIGHTRWATHGGPSTRNAHPHATDKVAVVHNGIIENYAELKHELEQHQVRFETETDTEVVAQLITHYMGQGMGPKDATDKTLDRLEGAYALAMIFAGEHDLMIGARQGTPLAVGFGEGEMFLASDSYALAPLTNKICFLEDGDRVVVTRKTAQVYDRSRENVRRQIRITAQSGAATGKGDYKHFMLKEIYEQPTVIGDTLNSFINPATGSVTIPESVLEMAGAPKITMVACGTAYYACMVAKYWFEQVARMQVEVDIASEFRYREAPMPEKGAAIVVSQSGETLDTLEAMRYCKRQKQKTLAIVNTIESTIEREADCVLHTLAGPEIGVASTKAFTTQLTTLACIAIAFAVKRGVLTRDAEKALTLALRQVPALCARVLNTDKTIEAVAKDIALARDVLYLGRGILYPLALEGALKLKEISYIHAEGYAAGEMKHGPIALIDDKVPIVCLAASSDPLFDKTASNIQESVARGGQILMISDKKGLEKIKGVVRWPVTMDDVHPFVSPILYAIPAQLLAYHVAIAKGTDVDQPRNLAKSVTVE
ncbi:MAG: glutamine--fructose-6-phosphate transaminase (isomerizing) [Proteobacteria bacterium]|nr:glutamine--fructose-6-phosphate transaminase (isomerizing) [Pseudomonadota bacterium]